MAERPLRWCKMCRLPYVAGNDHTPCKAERLRIRGTQERSRLRQSECDACRKEHYINIWYSSRGKGCGHQFGSSCNPDVPNVTHCIVCGKRLVGMFYS